MANPFPATSNAKNSGRYKLLRPFAWMSSGARSPRAQQNFLVTDDTAACELIGQPVKLVESAMPNPKVTVAADLDYIETLLKN